MLGLFAEETVAGPQLLSANGPARAGAPIAMRRKKERRVVMDEIIVGVGRWIVGQRSETESQHEERQIQAPSIYVSLARVLGHCLGGGLRCRFLAFVGRQARSSL